MSARGGGKRPGGAVGGWSKLATVREVVVVCSGVDAGVTVWDLNSGAVLSHLRSCAAPHNALACVGFHFLAAAQVHKPSVGSAGGGAIYFWAWHKVITMHHRLLLIASNRFPCLSMR